MTASRVSLPVSDSQNPDGRTGDAPTSIHPDCNCLYCTDRSAGFALATGLADLTAEIAGRMVAAQRASLRPHPNDTARASSLLARDVLAALDRLCPPSTPMLRKVAVGIEILRDAGRIAERLVAN